MKSWGCEKIRLEKKVVKSFFFWTDMIDVALECQKLHFFVLIPISKINLNKYSMKG